PHSARSSDHLREGDMDYRSGARARYASLICLDLLLSAGGEIAWAEDRAGAEAAVADASGAASDSGNLEEGTVTGIRAALQGALNLKRTSDVMVDAINAEDIAKFPDANLAESLQRLPGISVDRDNGEGRTITVRGLGSDFTRVRLNGLEALVTAAASDSGG